MQEFTIDELAAETGVPSRTIRFYQSKKALPAPERRGRIAVYSEAHVERLRLIARLQDQGLTIRAIRSVLASADRGEFELGDWLGVKTQIQAPWADDAPRIVSQDELFEITGSDRDGLIGDLTRLGFIERAGEAFLVHAPMLLKITMRLEGAGVDIDTTSEAARMLRKHLAKAATEVSNHFLTHLAQSADETSDPEHLGEVMGTLRPMALAAVQRIFAQEMEGALQRAIDDGRVSDVARRS
ncbi:MAG: MerR family transcriptional regulator [Myxococcales bacterium]|nr:MerR family transcriptional regulator [Myxococcales bacterium]